MHISYGPKWNFCCSSLEVIPPFLSFASNITAIAIVIIAKKNNYLLIVHGLGAASSVYLFSLPPRIFNAKTISMRNEELKKTNNDFSQQVQLLQRSVSAGQQNNTTLEATIKKFEDERELLHSTVQQLSEVLFPGDREKVVQLAQQTQQLLEKILKSPEQIEEQQKIALTLRGEIDSLRKTVAELDGVKAEIIHATRDLRTQVAMTTSQTLIQ